VDLVLAGPGLEQQFLDEAHVFRVRGREIRVIAPEHLVAVKVLAGRPKDIEDVRGLIRVAKIDHARVETTLRLLEQVLDQSDLRPVYARLRAEIRPAPRKRTKR
jgi:predicted nucleotidyltransferase